MNPPKQTLILLCYFLALSKVACFVVPPQQRTITKSPLQLSRPDNDNNIIAKTAPIMISIVTAALLFSNVATAAPLSAVDDHAAVTDSSSQLIAGRSGGRMGGRSSMGSRGGGYGGSSYTNIRRTTVVRPMVSSPSVIIAPPLYSPFGISPFGGFGLGFGLGGGFGDSYRDYRQDGELARERAELEQARMRSAELEQRIAQLEGTSNQQPLQLQQEQPVGP